jgi:hypothetical protein
MKILRDLDCAAAAIAEDKLDDSHAAPALDGAKSPIS